MFFLRTRQRRCKIFKKFALSSLLLHFVDALFFQLKLRCQKLVCAPATVEHRACIRARVLLLNLLNSERKKTLIEQQARLHARLHACSTGHHRCDEQTESCVPVNRRLYRCEPLPPPPPSAPPPRACAAGYRAAANGSCVGEQTFYEYKNKFFGIVELCREHFVFVCRVQSMLFCAPASVEEEKSPTPSCVQTIFRALKISTNVSGTRSAPSPTLNASTRPALFNASVSSASIGRAPAKRA